MSITKTGVLIDTNSSFSNPSTFEVVGKQSSVRVTGLSTGQTYYAKGFVIENGNTIYSTNTMSFQTQVRVVDYLTFTNTSSGTNTLRLIKSVDSGASNPLADIVLQYSINNGVWSTWESVYGDLSVTLSPNDTIKFRGDNPTFSQIGRGHYQFASSDDIEVSGKLITLIDSTGVTEDITSNDYKYAFLALFKDMRYLDTNNLLLPSGNIGEGIFYGLFEGCSSLTVAPRLAYDRWVGRYAFNSMFKDCTSLVNAPSLRNTVSFYTEGVCMNMFKNCTSLVATPEWYTVNAYGNSYFSGAFEGCSSLTTITSEICLDNRVQNQCYEMFKNCTSLTDISNIWYYGCKPGESACSYMFEGCSSLVTASVPPTLSLNYGSNRQGRSAYSFMFKDCVALEDMPQLPATTLAVNAYHGIFWNCTSLKYTHALPAVYMEEGAYQWAFYNCSSLEEAPEIYADATAVDSFNYMFCNCSNLKKVIIHTGTWIPSYAENWLIGTYYTGTVYNLGRASLPTNSYSGIPSGWTEINSI